MSRSAIVVAAVLGLLLVTHLFLRRHAPRPRPRVHGGVPGRPAVLRMRPGRYISLCTLALAPTGFLIWVVVTIRHGSSALDRGGLLLASAWVTAGLATGAWCLAAEFRERIRVDRGGIDWTGVLGRRRVPWNDIARVAYNPGHHWFFLTLADGTHLWIWDDLVGIAEFAELALAWLPPASLFADPWAREVLEELVLEARGA
jgi:hypothetical protein